MKLALAQLNTTVGDLRGNAQKILSAYKSAAAQNVDLVVVPEMAVTGYPPRDLLAKRRFVDETLQTLAEICSQIGQTGLLVGYVDHNEKRPGRPYHNACALLQNGKTVAVRYKTLLPTYDVFDEDRYFEPAESNEIVTFCGKKLGLTICEDLWTDQQFLPRPLYRRDPIAELRRQGAEILINISASPYHLGKETTRHELLRTTVRHHRLPVVYCNAVGGNDELIFDGESMVLDADGGLIARGKAFAEDLVVVDTERAKAIEFTPLSEMQALHDALVLGLRDYAIKCGFKSAVLGLSGGIDSSVVACLAVASLGNENVLGVSMPSQFSSRGSIEDAKKLAENLKIRVEIIPIQEPFQVLKAAFKDIFKGKPEDATEENMQARIRGQILMAISNKFGHLLLTTGNKSELAVGYCTLYGDMAGGLAVIADVPKTMIYKLARYINREREIIPESCFTKPPSAELRPNQTDQDTLPPYEVLDPILRAYIEEEKSAAEIAKMGFDEKLVREIVRKIDLNEYKRKQAPPCLRVTTKAFGIGRRMPIAQRYVER